MDYLPPHEIKRQILKSADTGPLARKIQNPPGISSGEILEMGNALKKTTETDGWGVIEQYMLQKLNPAHLINANEKEKGVAEGYITLMQWIDLTIQARDKILEQEKIHETKDVPKDQEK